MRILLTYLLALPIVSGTCLAQSSPTCEAAPAVTIDDREGVTVETLSFRGSFGKRTAHVFIPETAEPVAGVAFSHSSIQYADSLTDLLPFARAVARAGAASVMLDGTIDWHTPNDDAKRPVTEVNCAAQWLMANANLDLDRLAMGGPIKLEDPSERLPFCPEPDRQPCGQPWVYVGFGWANPIEIDVTELMKTPQGQLQVTRLLTDTFHLKEVQLEWLLENVLPKALAQR